MHILYLHQYFCPPGGSGNNRSFELAREWVRQGCKVTVLTSPAYFQEDLRRPDPAWRAEWEGVEVQVLNVAYDHHMGFRNRIRAWLRFYWKALRWLRQEAPEFELVYASSSPLTVGELGRKIGQEREIPFVYETVDVWPDVPIGMGIVQNELLIRWLHRRTNRMYAQASLVVALSEGMRDQILSHGTDPGKVIVVHNGCDPEAFPFRERTPGAETLVVYTGTVGIANGLDHLVRAAAHVQEAGRKDIRFLVLGEGNDLERVRGLARELKVHNLEFRGQVPKEQVGEVLARADIGAVCFAAHPVLEANSANKFYDYLASGLPVVLNYQGWQAEYLANWYCGMAVQQGDDRAYADAIFHLADRPKERLEMGRQGRKLVETHFDRKRLARTLLEHLRGLVQNK